MHKSSARTEEPFSPSVCEGGFCLRIPQWEEEYPSCTVGITLWKNPEVESQYQLPWGAHGTLWAQVVHNRRRLCCFLDMDMECWTMAEQVHDTRVAWVTPYRRGRGSSSREDAFPDADGLATDLKDVLLAICVADCVPVYLMYKEPDSPQGKPFLGLLHAGWRGTAGGIVRQVIPHLRKLWVPLSEVRVALGPSIGPCCFQVREDVAQLLLASSPCPSVGELDSTTGWWRIDLRAILVAQCVELGVNREHILVSQWCTCCSREPRFHSHRRQPEVGLRMAAWLGWRSNGRGWE
ncbi:polyphenol oxidase family protein [Pasteuria penetrans]|uniref:polyphenol oxidase family protein n=1 Tax=Pasteuria penetrans TaxID=86005 RepID=UPI00165C4EDF|nr:polyphenol oxidase family protein [Pasteuria penetrans]